MSGDTLLWAVLGAAWLVIAVQTFVLIELLRQVGILRMQVGDAPGALFVEGEGLERGTRAPAFEAIDARTGARISSTHMLTKKVLLIFLTTRCQACRELIQHVNQIDQRDFRDTTMAVVCSSPDADGGECSELAGEIAPNMPVLFDARQQISQNFAVRRTPSATLIIEGLVHLHAIPNTKSQLELLLDEEVTFSNAEWEIDHQREEGYATS